MNALSDLQQQAAKALASGKTPTQVRDELQLSISSFEAWRQSDAFVAEVQRLSAQDDDSEGRLDEALDQLSDAGGSR
jgi:hypothetical protein